MTQISRRKILGSFALGAALSFATPTALLAGDDKALPTPNKAGAAGSLMDALSKRKTTRAFKPDALPDQLLSDLLWAGFGVNRADGKRTAPSARNWQETTIYAAMADGLYKYDAAGNKLVFVKEGDLRPDAGKQGFVKTAPVVLIFTADTNKMNKMPDDMTHMYAAADVAFVSQNIYLFCAANDLGTVVLGMVDKEALAKKMALPAGEIVVFSQPVGFPK